MSQDIRIAIHHRPERFSEQWIAYCEQHHIAYECVDCYQSDIVQTLRSFDALMWHWSHRDEKALLFARQMITSLQRMGLVVFPDIQTCWHYDDKLGQKYLLEALGAPMIPSYVFYDKEEATAWIQRAEFPKVFKLRAGAASTNVRLVKTQAEALRLCKRAFGRGFPSIPGYAADYKNRLRKTRASRDYLGMVRRAPGIIHQIMTKNRRIPRQKGYLYFQDFLPGNDYDTRLVVIGDTCLGLRRHCRPNDFRASGSGMIDYDPDLIDKRAVEIAFSVAARLQSQCIAFDFLKDQDGAPRIVELSYAFPVGPFLERCPGYWDRNLQWHEENTQAEHLMVECVLDALQRRDRRRTSL